MVGDSRFRGLQGKTNTNILCVAMHIYCSLRQCFWCMVYAPSAVAATQVLCYLTIPQYIIDYQLWLKGKSGIGYDKSEDCAMMFSLMDR